jgi:hypothetical protein
MQEWIKDPRIKVDIHHLTVKAEVSFYCFMLILNFVTTSTSTFVGMLRTPTSSRCYIVERRNGQTYLQIITAVLHVHGCGCSP